MKKRILIHFVIIILFLFHPASSYYISGEIYISQTGNARLDLSSDLKEPFYGFSFKDGKLKVSTEELTLKDKGLWTFQLDLPKLNLTFIEIHLPSNLKSIIKIEGKDYLIDLDKKTITLLDSKSSFQLSYNLEDSQDYSFLIYPLIFILLIIFYWIYKKSKKRKEHLDHIIPIINENEQKIIEILMHSPLRQKEIRKRLNIPKASFSRYVFNLEKKKLIIIEGEGKNKILKLK